MSKWISSGVMNGMYQSNSKPYSWNLILYENITQNVVCFFGGTLFHQIIVHMID